MTATGEKSALRTVLVTGVAGFIGSHTAAALLKRGSAVVGVDDLSQGCRDRVPPGVTFHQLDIRRSGDLDRLLADRPVDAVVHMAAQVSVTAGEREPGHDREVNLDATAELARLAARRGVGVFVFASSAAVYGDPAQLPLTESSPANPRSAYGLHKWLAELYVAHVARQAGMRHVNLRLANVYGPGQQARSDGGVIAAFLDRLAAGEPLVLHGDGRQTRDFIYVGDVVEAVLAALEGRGSGTFNVSSGRETDLLTVIRHLAALVQQEPRVIHADPRPGDIRRSVLDPAAAMRDLGWSPRVSLEEGLALAWKHHPRRTQ
ncbi:MAG TPA: NAD-dependent epimerase/dehydratase family protein [Thermaerobacter sp.]|nr:UDP-glucose 4-epimerase [Bacillota bacterium]